MEVGTLLQMDNALNWRGAVVLGLLLAPIVISKIAKRIPLDLLFTVSALLTALCGIVSSKQLYQSGFNQAVFTMLGLWVIGKAMQQQGVFHACIPFIFPVKKRKLSNYILFFFQIALFGAFFHHRYFSTSTLQPLLREAEKKKADLKMYGFAFGALLLIGGLATAIGAPTNILFSALFSSLMEVPSSDLFVFLPFAILPIVLSFCLFFLLRKKLERPFSQFIDAGACALIPPDSLLIGKVQKETIIREGTSISKTTPLQSGDLILFTRTGARNLFSQVVLFISAVPSSASWKKIVTMGLFFSAILLTFFGWQIGTAFLLAGVLSLAIRPFSLKKIFQEEFPLSAFLEFFSAYVFFFAIQSSGLNAWIASYFPSTSALFLLCSFYILGQIAAHLMPRPIAFVAIFSIAQVLLNAHLAQLLLVGVNVAFAAALPLFGKPLLDETAISTAISGRSKLSFRVLLMFVVFGSTVIPTYLFWPS
jgi:hypothetical protein